MPEFVVQPRNYEDRHARMKKWIADLDKRLKQWLLDHPEEPYVAQKCLPPAPPSALFSESPAWSSTQVPNTHGMKISVIPSNYLDGGWVVWLNGKIEVSFYGEHAHADATKYADGLANGRIAPGASDDTEKA